MTKEEYKKRMSEIDKQMSDLAAERDKMIAERMALIRKGLAMHGLKVGENVYIITKDRCKYDCEFNDVRCDRHNHLYLEFTYTDHESSVGIERPVDVNSIESVLIPKSSIEFDYVPFMSNFQ